MGAVLGGVDNLGLFILAGWLLNLTPGPDVLCIVRHGLRGGVRAGAVAALGITAGCFVHIVAAALGLSALMATSATAFSVLKWVGAVYLLCMGLKLLWPAGGRWSRAAPRQPIGHASAESDRLEMRAEHSSGESAEGLKSVFFRGFLTNALNPKVALFFLAFVPQFIIPGASSPVVTFMLLGVLFNVNALPINLGYAVLAAWASRRVQTVQRALGWLDRLAGVMFVGFGVRLSLTESPSA